MKNGYALIKGFFLKEEIETIREQMEKIFENFSEKSIKGSSDTFLMKLFREDFDAFLGCAHLCQKLFSVYSIASSIKTKCFLQENCNMSFPVLNTKPLVSFSSKYTAKSEVYWKVGPHQDWPSNLGSKNGVTCWVPLVDVDEKIGPLEVIPRSHLFGPLAHYSSPPILQEFELERVLAENEFVPIPMKTGDALFFNTMLIHRSGTNTTDDRIRWSMHFRYNDANESSFIERKYPKNRTGD